MNDLVRWDEELAKYAKDVATRERPSVSQISTRSGILAYQGQPIQGNKLPCIIIGSAFENRIFDGKFDPNNMSSPYCFSLSISGEDMVPHPASPRPVAPSCAECPNSKWASDPEPGRKGKACKNIRRLALLPASSIKDGNIKTAEMAVVSIPVTSTKAWANYVNSIAAEFRRPPWAVITEIKLQPHMKFQFEFVFTTQGLVDDEILQDLFKRSQQSEDILLAPYESNGNIQGAPLGAVETPKKERKF